MFFSFFFKYVSLRYIQLSFVRASLVFILKFVKSLLIPLCSSFGASGGL